MAHTRPSEPTEYGSDIVNAFTSIFSEKPIFHVEEKFWLKDNNTYFYKLRFNNYYSYPTMEVQLANHRVTQHILRKWIYPHSIPKKYRVQIRVSKLSSIQTEYRNVEKIYDSIDEALRDNCFEMFP